MRKLILLSAIGFLLVGCGESKISDEMFIGDWECEVINYKSIWDKDNFSKFEKVDDKTSTKMSFKYENDFLYSKNFNNGEWQKFSLVGVYNNKTLTQESDYNVDKITQSLDRKSNDKYIFTYEHESTLKDDKYSLLNSKIKNEAICTRIK